MAKKTLLDIVQDILSDMSSDEVNSISDTTEALQVAQIVRATYEDLMTRKAMPHLKSLFRLDATSSATPTHMKLPVAIMEVISLRYDRRLAGETDPRVREISYLEPIAFLDRTNGRDSDLNEVDNIAAFGAPSIKIKNNVPPTVWTSFDDEYVVFDSYDSAVEANVQNSKSQMLGYSEPNFPLVDSTVADMPSELVSYFLSEAKKQCMGKLKQVNMSDTGYREEVERNKKQNTYLQRKKWRLNKLDTYPNYGRK